MSWKTQIEGNVDRFMDEMNVPIIGLDDESKSREPLVFPKLDALTDQELSEYITKFGGYKAYLEGQLAYIDSRRSLTEELFDEALGKAMFRISVGYPKKPTKELLRAEAIEVTSGLAELRIDFLELDTLYKRVMGVRDSYKSAYEAVSRLVSLRAAMNGRF
jgi:hypothetical protein|tara:strand:+ start:1620 stop:2102 length:483 start_codon:yes stop_codon:yes gene_type:complete